MPISSPLLFIPHFAILSLFLYLFYLFSVAKIVPKADEIKDASAFLRMRTSEKRACLRASGALEVELKFRKRRDRERETKRERERERERGESNDERNLGRKRCTDIV